MWTRPSLNLSKKRNNFYVGGGQICIQILLRMSSCFLKPSLLFSFERCFIEIVAKTFLCLWPRIWLTFKLNIHFIWQPGIEVALQVSTITHYHFYPIYEEICMLLIYQNVVPIFTSTPHVGAKVTNEQSANLIIRQIKILTFLQFTSLGIGLTNSNVERKWHYLKGSQLSSFNDHIGQAQIPNGANFKIFIDKLRRMF